jgi:arylsulfatase A-like enzyme
MKVLLIFMISALGHASAATKPNFILILADDMGWNDAGFSGGEFMHTPNLDRMAKEGMVFEEACASAPNCAPTRACLLTGRYPSRHGVYTVVDERHAPGSPHHRILAAASRDSLPTEALTLAEALKPAGYATGMFGMWNLGRGRSGPTTPAGQGFDVFTEPKRLGFEKDAYRDAAGRYSPDVLTDAALKWMESVKDRPFFLYLPFHDVHAPHDPKPELLAKDARIGVTDPAHAATVEAMDANVGRLLAALDRSGVAQRTYIIFTSDNGGTRRYVAPLRGGKGTLYQGGIRVPAAIRGPGIKPGSASRVTMLSMDWYPTVMELAEIRISHAAEPDGRSLVPVLSGRAAKLERDVFWHFPCYTGGGGPCSAIRSGEWKLIEFFESGTSALYQLTADPGEMHDRSPSEPARAAELLARLHAWQAATGAPRPTQPNPAYDPNSVKQRGNQGRRPSRTNKQP